MANEQRGGSGNFSEDRERASEAGKKGAEQRQSQSGASQGEHERGGKGNFAENPERASEAGKKGGQH